jgi:hypothetical protein
MAVAALIGELKQAYVSAGLDCGDCLLPPAEKTALDMLSQQLGLPVPPELREVYQVHGGQQYIEPGVSGLFGEHRLLTPAEVLDHHRMYCENCLLDPLPVFPPLPDEWGYWVPQLIPFASWDAYDLCIDSASGEVWEFIPNSGLIRHRPSIAAVLQEILAAVRSGAQPQLQRYRLSAERGGEADRPRD